MRWTVLAAVFLVWTGLVSAAAPALEGNGAEEWLNRAADATLPARYREYAARRVVMLAGESASILIAAVGGGDGHASALRRQVAATLLGETAPPEAEAALLEAAFGNDGFLAEAAKRALANLYSRLPDNTLYTLLTRGARSFSGDPASGASAGEDDWLALSLRQAGFRGRFKALVMAGLARKYAAEPKPLPEPLTWCVWDGLIDIDPGLRLASVETLPFIASSLATERLAALLYTETDTDVLLAALGVMAALRPPQYGEAVERHAGHADPRVAVEALAALAAMGYPGVLFSSRPGARAVASYVNHPSTPVRRRVIGILAGSGNPAAVEYLEAALFDRAGANRAAAAQALGELGFPSAVGALHPLLNDGRPEVREEAAVALAGFGVVGVTSRVVDGVRDGALPFRIAAAGALGRMGDARAVPALMECLESGEFALVAAAIDALGLLGDRRAGGGLLSLLERTDDVVLAEGARQALRNVFLSDPGDDPSAWGEWAKENGIARPGLSR